MESGSGGFLVHGPPTRLGRLVLAGAIVGEVPKVSSPLRVMDAYVVSVVTAGAGRYRHADGSEQPLRAGSVTIVPPETPHWYGTDRGEPWSEIFAVFSGPIFDSLADAGVLDGRGPTHPRPPPPLGALRATLQLRPRSASAAEHQLVALADWLVGARPPESAPELSEEIAEAASLLGADPRASLDLHTVAATVGLSYDTLRRRFAQEVGQPPIRYRNTLRLEAAAALLRLTDETTYGIARSLGYGDEFHFSRQFRARYGEPPSSYRRRHRTAPHDRPGQPPGGAGRRGSAP